MPELSFRDCKYKRKNSFRQNFPGKIPDFAVKGMLRAIRPSNAAPPRRQGPRQKPTPRPLPARPSSGPKCRDRDPRRNSRRNAQTIRSPEGEIIRPIGPEPRLHFQAVSGQHPSNELRPLTTDRRGPLPPFQTTVSANAIGPEHPVLPPVRTRLPGNRAVRLAGPVSTRNRSGQNPPENAGRPPGRKTRSEPAPHPPRMPPRKTDTPGRRAGGVANLSGNRAPAETGTGSADLESLVGADRNGQARIVTAFGNLSRTDLNASSV